MCGTAQRTYYASCTKGLCRLLSFRRVLPRLQSLSLLSTSDRHCPHRTVLTFGLSGKDRETMVLVAQLCHDSGHDTNHPDVFPFFIEARGRHPVSVLLRLRQSSGAYHP